MAQRDLMDGPEVADVNSFCKPVVFFCPNKNLAQQQAEIDHHMIMDNNNTPVPDPFVKEEIDFLNSLAVSNFSATVLFITDQDPSAVLIPNAVLHAVTNGDMLAFVHVHDYAHLRYLQFLKTLHLNAPMNLTTSIVRGEDPCTDLQIYDDASMDIIFIFYKNPTSFPNLFVAAWQKLKGNGNILIKGIDHTDVPKLNQLQGVFGQFIRPPQGVRININLIEKSKNLIVVKKPCY